MLMIRDRSEWIGFHVSPFQHLGDARHEVPTRSVSGDSGYRIDGNRCPGLRRGRYDAGWSLLQTCPSERALPGNGARDGDGHTWPSDSERRQRFQLPADQLSERRISTGIHGRVRSTIRQTIVKPGRRGQMFAAPFFETPN